jgi:hypothetical protein
MLSILAGLGEFERHLILSRPTKGGNVQTPGASSSAESKLTKHQRDEALHRKRSGETLTEIGRSYNVSHMTISRLERRRLMTLGDILGEHSGLRFGLGP